MRENTGRQIITTVNFAEGEHSSHTWTEAETTQIHVIDDYAEAHEGGAQDIDYLMAYGIPEVFEYVLPGLRVVALATGGQVDTVFTVEDADTARYHTAARTGRTMGLRYVKTDGSVSHREVQVGSVRLTKDGNTVVRALDVRKDEERSFRADRITHSTLHRVTAPARPTKAALAAAFRATVTEGLTGRVHNVRRSYSGTVQLGSRAFGPSGWSVIVELDPEFAHLTPGGTVRDGEDELIQVVALPAPRTAAEESGAWYLYDTAPDTPAALEAPESVQDKLAEAFASGRQYVKVYA